MTIQSLNCGFFDSMRRTHPYRIGDVIDGKRVTATYYKWKDNINDPYVKLDYTEEKLIKKW